MDVERQERPNFDKVASLIEEIKFAMLTTVGPDGALHSRPMSTMQVDRDGCLWFFTGRHSGKVSDLDESQFEVNLAYARTDKQDYLSVAGTAEVVDDREKMKQLWTPWIKPWFPDGVDDPELVLLKVTVHDAEYWDAPGSTVKRLYGLAKGIVTGKTDGLGEHGTAVRH